jgi:Na+/melibiose symporter-like transporter
LLLFFPAAIGATGFLQAALHFCAGFGMQGVFNFGPQVGKTDTVEQAEFRLKDRRTALRIGLYSMAIGIAIAIAGFSLVAPSMS